ncbi:hypothetical protein CBB_A0020 [Clostridium botulinum Bf]|nr:hypothetical protein CBB_A0020 [Clostridium botulinum Bf]
MIIFFIFKYFYIFYTTIYLFGVLCYEIRFTYYFLYFISI